jgi:hypothetical protein
MLTHVSESIESLADAAAPSIKHRRRTTPPAVLCFWKQLESVEPMSPLHRGLSYPLPDKLVLAKRTQKVKAASVIPATFFDIVAAHTGHSSQLFLNLMAETLSFCQQLMESL